MPYVLQVKDIEQWRATQEDLPLCGSAFKHYACHVS